MFNFRREENNFLKSQINSLNEDFESKINSMKEFYEKEIEKLLNEIKEKEEINSELLEDLQNIKKLLDENKKVIIAAHGNSLRALIKYLEKISDEDIVNLNLPTGVPIVYELDDYNKVVSKRYLGNQAEIEAKMNKVANQGCKNNK